MDSRDVQRLLCTLLPALSLTGLACDSKSDGPTPAAKTANAKGDGGKTVDAKGDGGKKGDDGKTADAKGDGGKTKAEPIPKEVADPGSCPTGKWCAPRKAALKIASKKKPSSLGCPPQLAGKSEYDALQTQPEYGGIYIASDAFSARIDEVATEAKRGSGDAETCCYSWVEQCPGGRPFLDEAAAPVVAAFRSGSTWQGDRIAVEGADEGARLEAARQWQHDAAMEHASAASFGRVALELMALGGPPELLEETHRAALDEIEHAKTCLAIAVAFGAQPVEPGPLPVSGPRVATLARFAADTFIEGCVGETTAALVMERSAEAARGESLRAAIAAIAGDEARHAALAWRTVAWAIAEGGADVVAAVERQAAQLRETLPAVTEKKVAGELESLGRLGDAQLAAARRDAWLGIIEPMLAQLKIGGSGRTREPTPPFEHRC